MVNKKIHRHPRKQPPPQPEAGTQRQTRHQEQGLQTHAHAHVSVQVEIRHQQRLLDLFCTALRPALDSPDLPALLHDVKQALFDRDFARAFGHEGHLGAYAVRWSPTRALCYAAILRSGVVRECLDDLLLTGRHAAASASVTEAREEGVGEVSTEEVSTNEQVVPEGAALRMIAIGGCAAEQVAFASLLHNASISGTLTLLDSGPWTQVVNLLQDAITTAPPLSKYASAAVKETHAPLVPASRLSLSFQQMNILVEPERLALFSEKGKPVLVTLFFTLNELYTSGGIAQTTRFMAALEKILPRRSLLLVVDSPGSYSMAALGKENKRYPMQWLLDHTLRDPKRETPSWERLETQDSVWFRLSKELSYPLQLEDMRYQIHLYRLRVEDGEK